MEYNDLMQKLISKNFLTVVNNKICIVPHNQYDFTTYPIDINDCVYVTYDEYIGLITGVYMFNDTLNCVIDCIDYVDRFEEEERLAAEVEQDSEEQK